MWLALTKPVKRNNNKVGNTDCCWDDAIYHSNKIMFIWVRIETKMKQRIQNEYSDFKHFVNSSIVCQTICHHSPIDEMVWSHLVISKSHRKWPTMTIAIVTSSVISKVRYMILIMSKLRYVSFTVIVLARTWDGRLYLIMFTNHSHTLQHLLLFIQQVIHGLYIILRSHVHGILALQGTALLRTPYAIGF